MAYAKRKMQFNTYAEKTHTKKNSTNAIDTLKDCVLFNVVPMLASGENVSVGIKQPFGSADANTDEITKKEPPTLELFLC